MRLRNPHPQCGAGTHFSFSHSTTTVPLPCRVWYTCSILSEVSPAWSLHRPSLSCHCHWPFFSPIKQMAFNVFTLILLEGFFIWKDCFKDLLYTKYVLSYFFSTAVNNFIFWADRNYFQQIYVTEWYTQGNWCPIHFFFFTRKLFSLPVLCPGNYMVWVSEHSNTI